MADISAYGVDHIFILGDIVNGIEPNTCVDIVRGLKNTTTIPGNGDKYMLTPDLEDFPYANSELMEYMISLSLWWQDQVSTDNKAWMSNLPEYATWQNSLMVHDTPQERLYPESWHAPDVSEKYQELNYHSKGILTDISPMELDKHFTFMEDHGYQQVFCGHTHQPITFTQGNKTIINVGSVGQPLDGDPRACWVLFEGSSTTLKRVEYDVEAFVQQISNTPDYPGFQDQAMKTAFMDMFRTGHHWREILQRRQND